MVVLLPLQHSQWLIWDLYKVTKRGWWLIWLATLWMLWKVRNDKIFKRLVYEVDEIVEEVKVLSWRWLLSRTKTPGCLYYEWCWDPILCFRRKVRR